MQGWILRFSRGYTKRANSVNVLTPIIGPYEDQVKNCEVEYNKKNLPCIFRLLSFNDNAELETVLDARGYNRGDHSLVLVQDLKKKTCPNASLKRMKIADWMTHYCRLSGKDPKDHHIHVEIINKIQDDCLLAVLLKNDQEVTCGLGVIHNGLFGIFDIVTHRDQRNRGYGTELVNALLSWAVAKGAGTAYVQVIDDNKPAISLYHKLGYQPAYEYHYRIQDHRPC